jgi:hypothetical protein
LEERRRREGEGKGRELSESGKKMRTARKRQHFSPIRFHNLQKTCLVGGKDEALKLKEMGKKRLG